MSAELTYQGETATPVYAVAHLGTQYLAGATPEAYSAGHWATYAIALTDQGNGYKVGDFPAAAAGVYSLGLYKRVGEAPATTDPVLATGELVWSGTAEVTTGGLSTQLGAINAKTRTISGSVAATDLGVADEDGFIEIRKGDTYGEGGGNPLTLTITGQGALADSLSYWRISVGNKATGRPAFWTVDATATNTDGDLVITAELSTTQTDAAALYVGGEFRWDAEGRDQDPEGENPATIVRTFSGLLSVLPDVTA